MFNKYIRIAILQIFWKYSFRIGLFGVDKNRHFWYTYTRKVLRY